MFSLAPRLLFEGGAGRLGAFQTGLDTTKRSAPGSVNNLRNGANKLDYCRNSAFAGHRIPKGLLRID